MKKYLSIIIISLITFSAKAQNFSGKAIYKSYRKSNFKISDDSKMTEKQKEAIEARFKKMNEKTYILNFDKNESTYKEDVKLDAPKPQLGNQNVMVMSFGGSGNNDIYYKNLKENRFVNQTEIMSKPFLVKDSLNSYDWQLSSEKKNIGNYTCYKATFSKEVENINMTFGGGEPKELKEKKIVITTAWYSPEIPVTNGPKNYQGLPGLILEINDGTTTIACTEIIINPNKKNIISEPLKGKIVNQKEYSDISKKKSKEMMERFKSRNGVELGNGVRVKIGG